MKPLPLPSKILFLATKLFGVLLALLFTNTGFAATNHWSGTSCAAPVVGSCDWSAADAGIAGLSTAYMLVQAGKSLLVRGRRQLRG